MSSLPVTSRSRLHRRPQRGSYDASVIFPILDEGLLAHIGFALNGQPVVLPMTYCRLGNRLYLHGAKGNHMLQALHSGAEACVTVTLLDGLVLARSAYNHSMNYRSVVLFGQGIEVTDMQEKKAALQQLLERMLPGRSDAVRAPSAEELAATLLIAFPITEGSAKIRSGPPVDNESDQTRPCWAGVIPLRLAASEPIAAAGVDSTKTAPTYTSQAT
jgi:uncharacterized protein